MGRSFHLGALWLCTLAIPAAGRDFSMGRNGMLHVNGKPFFVLGLYENPQEDAVLDQASKAGFNLIHASNKKEDLDRLESHGLWAWVNTGYSIDLSVQQEQRKEELKKLAQGVGTHPALLVWEVPDEALWNCWYGASQWRTNYEPKQLREAFANLEDTPLRAKLEGQLREALRLHHRGEFAQSEQMADSIWEEMGEKPHKPDLNVSNAPERAAKMAAGMVKGYKELKRLDPVHPVWMNHAPRNQISQMAKFNLAADIVGCDIYPAPAYRGGHSDLPDRSLGSVGAYTDRMQAAAPGKPVWMVLQGFGWADLQDNPSEKEQERGRRPDFEESRFMAFDAIVHGARGILYWGTRYVERDSTLWIDLLRLVKELSGLQEVLSAPDLPTPEVTLAEHWGSLERGVRVLGKNVQGKTWWIVVNEYSGPLRYTLHGLDELNGQVFEDPDAKREAVVKEGCLTCNIESHGIQVLRPAGR